MKIFLGFLGVFYVASTFAAPSVRMLGTSSAQIGNNATVVKADSSTNTNASTQRLGSIRSKVVNSGSPVAVNKVVSTSIAADENSDARLSLGKYIHSTGVSAGTIKPAGAATSTTPTASSSDLLALTERVKTLEDDKFTIGDGLAVDENNEVSLDSAAVQNQIEGVLGGGYYTATEVDAKLAEQAENTTHTYRATIPVGSSTSEELVDVWVQ